MWPLWITPRPAVALNLAQLTALLSQSRFSRRKVSTVVPACVMAFANTSAPWHTLLRVSIITRATFSMFTSAWLFEKRNSSDRLIEASPERMLRSLSTRAAYSTSAGS